MTNKQKVEIYYTDHRQMIVDEQGDPDMDGGVEITISADAADIGQVVGAVATAATLQMLAELGRILPCPYSDSRLSVAGVSDGDIMLQIWRGEQKGSCTTVTRICHLDPRNYSRDPEAEKAVGWMRDVAMAISRYREVWLGGSNQDRARERDRVWAAVHGAGQFTPGSVTR